LEAMRRRSLLLSVIAGVAGLFVAAGIYAACPGEYSMEEKVGYEKHEKGPVIFNHTKHSGEYEKQFPDLFKLKCGECHHNDKHEPLSNLTCDDKVQHCIDCHKKPGEVPSAVKKEWRAKKLSKEEQTKLELEYHAEALHANCIDCHKEYNKTYKPKTKAPTTCTKCHEKKA
jgi:hypothetical protein